MALCPARVARCLEVAGPALISPRQLQWSVLATIVWGALSFGGAYPWGYWSLGAAAAAIGGWVFVRTHAWWDARIRSMVALSGVIAAAMACQVVPLPRAVMMGISPAADRVLAESSVPYLLEPPAWHTLSIAPGATMTAIAVFAALALMLAGLTYVMGRLARERLVLGITAFGAMLAVFAVMQQAANVRSADNQQWQLVYGFWKPQQAGNVFGPFINRNHFAGWMVMAVSLAIGYSCAALESAGVSVRDGWQRWVRWSLEPAASRVLALAVAVVLMGASLVVSGSRSGMASLAVSVAMVAYLAGRRVGSRRLRVLAAGYLLALIAGAILWAGVGRVVGRFALASTDAESRLAAWQDTWHIVRDFPLVGTGIGGYGPAMLVYQTVDRQTFYAHAHNDYLQVVAEGGMLVGVPVAWALVALVGRIRARVVNGADPPDVYWMRAGAIAGLAGIATQSFVDFSLQLVGNAVLCVVLMALALHRSDGTFHASRI